MTTDLLLLTAYVALATYYRKRLNIALLVWFVLSVVIGFAHLPSIIIFPIYWFMALGVTCYSASRGSWSITICMGTMALLQLALSVDSVKTNEITALYNHYPIMALLVNLFIIGASIYHGRGYESVDSIHKADAHNRVSHHHNNNA
jgi:hypothetical protein